MQSTDPQKLTPNSLRPSNRTPSKTNQKMNGSEDHLLDREKLKDLCSELSKGKRDVIDDRLMQVLSCLAEQMCDELVDFSC